MTKKEIIKLGITLGLKYNEKDNYPSSIRVVFNGINGQRFLYETDQTDDEILERMGDALQLMGRRQLKLELSHMLSPMSDN